MSLTLRPVNRTPLEPAAPAEHGMAVTQPNQPAGELQQAGVRGRPVVPRNLVVLAVGVVVPSLRAADLVAPEQHRHPLRQEQRRQEIPRLARAQREHVRIVRRTFLAEVPRSVVAFAVAVLFAVGLVVLVVVRHEVAQRKAVVRRDEVDARVRPPRGALIEIGAAREAERELGERLIGAAPEIADGVAVLAVPLRPERRKVADLIPALADVPRLGDELDLADHGILLDQIEEGRQPVDVVQLARERRGEIEAEAVDVHVVDPVAQAVHDELQHVRVAHVQRVARARVVHVVAAVVRHEPVVRGIVDPLEREHRPELVALGRVVVDHVEDHFDPRRVERLHELLELLHLPATLTRGRILVVGREIGDGVVAPVVPKAPLHERRVLDELVDRQQLHRRDAEFFQVVDGRRMRQSRVGAAQLLGNIRMRLAETFHVRLVHDRVVQRGVGRAVEPPVERRVDHDALGDERDTVEVVLRVLRFVEVIRENRFVPVPQALDRLGVRIEQQLRGIAPMSVLRRPRTVHSKAVALARPDSGHVPVPAQRRGFRQIHHVCLMSMLVEEAELDTLRRFREHGEVRARAVEMRAKGIRLTWPDLHSLSD